MTKQANYDAVNEYLKKKQMIGEEQIVADPTTRDARVDMKVQRFLIKRQLGKAIVRIDKQSRA